MYIMFIVHSWPAFCHAANKRRLMMIDNLLFQCPDHLANRTRLMSDIQGILSVGVNPYMQFQCQSCLCSPQVDTITSRWNNVNLYSTQRLNIYSCPNAVYKLSLVSFAYYILLSSLSH